MTDEELRQLIASNARAIEAAADERAELRQGMVDVQQAILTVQQAILRLTDLQEGIANLFGRLDEDRPAVLRKLNAIENKIDQLLEQRDDRPF